MRFLGLSACVLLFAGCAEPQSIDDILAVDAAAAGPSAKHGNANRPMTVAFFTARPDYRKCISPLCGGWWVAQIGARKTTCADGHKAEECYVAQVNWDTAGGAIPTESAAVLHGSISSANISGFDIGVFDADDGWRAVSGAQTVEDFYSVRDTGIRCVKSPCFYIEATEIGPRRPKTLSLSGFDTSGLKITADDQNAVWDAMSRGRLISTGHTVVTQELTGEGEVLVAEELFLPVQ